MGDAPMSGDDGTRAMWRAASRFSYVGIFFGVAVVVGWLGGSWLERRVGGAPWVSLAGVLFGIAAGFRELFRIARFVTDRSKQARSSGDGAHD